MRREVASAISERLGKAVGPTCLLVPTQGIEGWDRPGQPLHDPEGLEALVEGLREGAAPNTELHVVDAHINDAAFSAAALQVFDRWVALGLIAPGVLS